MAIGRKMRQASDSVKKPGIRRKHKKDILKTDLEEDIQVARPTEIPNIGFRKVNTLEYTSRKKRAANFFTDNTYFTDSMKNTKELYSYTKNASGLSKAKKAFRFTNYALADSATFVATSPLLVAGGVCKAGEKIFGKISDFFSKTETGGVIGAVSKVFEWTTKGISKIFRGISNICLNIGSLFHRFANKVKSLICRDTDTKLRSVMKKGHKEAVSLYKKASKLRKKYRKLDKKVKAIQTAACSHEQKKGLKKVLRNFKHKTTKPEHETDTKNRRLKHLKGKMENLKNKQINIKEKVDCINKAIEKRNKVLKEQETKINKEKTKRARQAVMSRE